MVFFYQEKLERKSRKFRSVVCSVIDIISPYSNSFSPNEKIDLSFCGWLDWTVGPLEDSQVLKSS